MTKKGIKTASAEIIEKVKNRIKKKPKKRQQSKNTKHN